MKLAQQQFFWGSQRCEDIVIAKRMSLQLNVATNIHVRFFQATLRFGAVVLQWLLWCGDHLFYVIVAPKRFVFPTSCTLCFALCFSTIINSPCHIVVHFMQ
jgi:hypothetical protein